LAEAISSFIVVVVAIGLIYAIDALVSRRAATRLIVKGAVWLLAAALFAAGAVWLSVALARGDQLSAPPVGFLLAGAVLALVLAPAGRRLVACLLPISAHSTRDLAGFVILLWLVIVRVVQFYAVDDEFAEVSIWAAAIQTLALLGIAIAAVGFLTRRSPRATLARLGLNSISALSVVVGFAAVIPMAVAGIVTVNFVELLSPGTSERLSETVEQITGGQSGIGYALALGVSAAVGEETLFRGALQPKYGLIFTSLVFALLHVQYDLLLVVASLFPVGLILGLERRYLGTLACIITHTLYNTLAVAV
jgi:membrane protease YdiL (CAAX protease family)